MLHFPKALHRTLPHMDEKRRGRPTVAPDRAAAMWRAVRELVDGEFRGNQAEAAKALGVSGATVSNFLSRKTSVGSGIERGVTRYLRRSFDQIVEAGGSLAVLRGGAPAPSAPVETRFGDLPNWPELYRMARDNRPNVPRWAWELCARARVFLDVPITPPFIAEIAYVIAHNVPPPAGVLPAETDDSTPSAGS